MKNYFLLVLSLLLGMSANAQMANAPLKKDAYSDAAKRTTIVVLQSEDPKKSTKLKKTPEDYEAYKMDIEYFNENLKASVEKWWRFTEKYEFHSYAEMTKMVKGKAAKNYVVLIYQQQRNNPAPPSQVINAVLPYKRLSTPEEWGCFELRTPENLLPSKPALDVVKLPYQAPSIGDMVFAMHVMQFNLANKSEGLSESQIKMNVKNAGKLIKNKTLYMDRTEIDDNELNEQVIHKAYPYEYVIDERDSIQQYLIRASGDALVPMIVPGNNMDMVHYLISAEDGTICGMYSLPYDAKDSRRLRITREVLKVYAKMGKTGTAN